MKHYVVGLPFTAAADRVVLVRKNRPDWQAGKLNGPGGKVEPGETALQAIVREVSEECGVSVPAARWNLIAVKEDDQVRVDIFSCFNDVVAAATRRTDEDILLLAPDDPRIGQQGLEHMALLIARALERSRTDVLQLATSRPKAAAVAPWP